MENKAGCQTMASICEVLLQAEIYNSEPEIHVNSLSSETPQYISNFFFDCFLLLLPSYKQKTY